MNKVTRSKVATLFSVPVDRIEQVKSKQLFIVTLKNTRVLVSYETIVAVYKPNINQWVFNEKKFSRTTTAQCNAFKRTVPDNDQVMLPDSDFNDLVMLALTD